MPDSIRHAARHITKHLNVYCIWIDDCETMSESCAIVTTLAKPWWILLSLPCDDSGFTYLGAAYTDEAPRSTAKGFGEIGAESRVATHRTKKLVFDFQRLGQGEAVAEQRPERPRVSGCLSGVLVRTSFWIYGAMARRGERSLLAIVGRRGRS